MLEVPEGCSSGPRGKDPWADEDFTKLIEFNKFLGMHVEGFEEEIWSMLNKLTEKVGSGTPPIKGGRRNQKFLATSLFTNQKSFLAFNFGALRRENVLCL